MPEIRGPNDDPGYPICLLSPHPKHLPERRDATTSWLTLKFATSRQYHEAPPRPKPNMPRVAQGPRKGSARAASSGVASPYKNSPIKCVEARVDVCLLAALTVATGSPSTTMCPKRRSACTQDRHCMNDKLTSSKQRPMAHQEKESAYTRTASRMPPRARIPAHRAVEAAGMTTTRI